MPPAHRPTRKPVGVPILNRSLDLLEFLSQCPAGIALSPISRALRIPKNTAYRMLNTLCERGYVVRNEASVTYRLTRRLATLVYSSAQEGGLIERALPPMRALRDRVKETVVISILDQGEGLVLDQVPGLHAFRFVCDPGTRQPVHASASTKAILANMEPALAAAVLKSVKYARLTDRTITSAAGFRRELEQTRVRGYGVDCGEALQGVHCVAAAVLDHHRTPVAAITVTGPSERLPAKGFADLGRLVRACAEVVSASLA